MCGRESGLWGDRILANAATGEGRLFWGGDVWIRWRGSCVLSCDWRGWGVEPCFVSGVYLND